MKRISYSGGSFLTSDAVADALLQLTAALGRSGSAETVDVPTVNESGDISALQLVLGPASQLTSQSEKSTVSDPDAPETVIEIERLAALVGPSRPVVEDRERITLFDPLGEL